MSEKGKKIVILGAGVAGLSTAWKLLRENPRLQVTLIERDSQPGGLAKSIEWNEHILDLGPHRFYTEIPEVKEFIHTFCEERMASVKRASRMFLNGRYIPYPIQPIPTYQALGFSDTVSFLFSALGVLWNKKKNAVSYEDYVIGYYGEKLYRRIFQPFAEKVWGIAADQIAAETARVRLRGENIWHALKDGWFSKQETYVAQFLYPSGGIGEIPQKFAEEIIQMGGSILTKHKINRINLKQDHVHKVEVNGPLGPINISCDLLVNTIPMNYLPFLMIPQASEDILASASAMHYRALTLLYLHYNEELPIDDTWLYFPEDSIPFSRISIPDNFAPHKKQPGKSCLCVEFPCEIDGEIWKQDASTLAGMVDDVLQSSGVINSRSVDTLVVHIKEGYPLYQIGYELHRQKIVDYLRSLGNCISTGRQGLFRHNNLDQSIQMGLSAAEQILQNDHCNQWYDHIDRFNDYRIVD